MSRFGVIARKKLTARPRLPGHCSGGVAQSAKHRVVQSKTPHAVHGMSVVVRDGVERRPASEGAASTLLSLRRCGLLATSSPSMSAPLAAEHQNVRPRLIWCPSSQCSLAGGEIKAAADLRSHACTTLVLALTHCAGLIARPPVTPLRLPLPSTLPSSPPTAQNAHPPCLHRRR